jgi:hypothetical protein
MTIVLAVLAWVVWTVTSGLSSYIFWKFVKPKDLSPEVWVQNLFPVAEIVVRANAILALVGVIVSIALILI